MSIHNYQIAVGGYSNEILDGYSNRAYIMRCEVGALGSNNCGNLVWVRISNMKVPREGKCRIKYMAINQIDVNMFKNLQPAILLLALILTKPITARPANAAVSVIVVGENERGVVTCLF